MEENLTTLLKNSCTCQQCENRIVLEVVNLCPDCMFFMSTAMYEVPSEKIEAVMSRFDEVMREFGVKSKGKIKIGPITPPTGEEAATSAG